MSLGWDEVERTGHNPTVYLDASEERYYESGQWKIDEEKKNWKPDNGCWNCKEYDGNYCMRAWNNADKDFCIPWRDAKAVDHICDDWEEESNIDWREYFEED